MAFTRLTQRDKKNPNIVHTICANCEYTPGSCSGWQCATALARRLAKYEDTGVSPKDVSKRQKRYIYLGMHHGGPAYQCPVCKTSLVGFPPDSCPACGTGMEINSINVKA